MSERILYLDRIQQPHTLWCVREDVHAPQERSSNREYRSDTFSMLLMEKKYALDVYNAMNDTDYNNPDDLEIYMLENGFSLTVRNDASFLIDNQLCLYEHQGSFNPNMPIRAFLYLADLMRSYIRQNKLNLYGSQQLHLPIPKFAVFYNGRDDRPEVEEFRLSDAFEGLQEEPQVELICRAYNINPDKGQALKEKSYVLRGYCFFVEKVRAHLDVDMTLYDALDKAIQECIREHILEDFFREHGNEVRKMEVLDFSFEARIELEKRDARIEGEREGERRGELRGELRGERRGFANSILIVLGGDKVPQEISSQLYAIESEEVLKDLLLKATSVQSLEQFTTYMKDIGVWKETVLTQ